MAKGVHFDRNAVVTVQGGGLYGLTLLGQMDAALSNSSVLAVAGTSAGAIIAALVWAGWTPIELRDRLCCHARRGFLHSLPGDFEPPTNPFDLRSWKSMCMDVSSLLTSAVGGSKGRNRFWKVLSRLSLMNDAQAFFDQALPHWRNRGIFIGQRLEEFVEELLREALIKRSCNDLPKAPLTFGDIRKLSESRDDLYFPPLLLAATNVGTQNVELINSLDEKYDGVSVARAVRASSGYPVFFRPVEMPELKHASWFIDGGVISNFPAWVFSREFRDKMHASDLYRGLAYRPWVHIGLRLVEKDVKDEEGHELPLYDHSQLKRPSVFARALIRLMIGQARNRLEDLISRGLARSVILAQPMEESGGPGDLFDFDAINERRVRNMFAAGSAYAKRHLSLLSFEVTCQEAVSRVLSDLVDRVRSVIDPWSKQTDLRVRSNIFFPSASKLELVFQVNMDGDSDIAMSFTAPDQGLTGFCYLLRRPLVCNLEKIAEYVENAGETLFNMTPEQQSMVDRSRTWLASTPIFDPNDIVFRTSMQSEGELGPDQFSTRLDTMVDGPMFGVLNVDANINYDVLCLDADPENHVTDARVSAIIDMMNVAAGRLGQLFGSNFASRACTHKFGAGLMSA
jgi:predicted acylesterase/phospholipase RssA